MSARAILERALAAGEPWPEETITHDEVYQLSEAIGLQPITAHRIAREYGLRVREDRERPPVCDCGHRNREHVEYDAGPYCAICRASCAVFYQSGNSILRSQAREEAIPR